MKNSRTVDGIHLIP